jgi:hypothetical protein
MSHLPISIKLFCFVRDFDLHRFYRGFRESTFITARGRGGEGGGGGGGDEDVLKKAHIFYRSPVEV